MTLSILLGPIEPHDVSLKKAWKAVIQATRDRRRRTGRAGPWSGMAQVERIRNRPLRTTATQEALVAFKTRLRSLLRADPGSADRDLWLSELEVQLDTLVCQVQTSALAVELRGWPDRFDRADLERLLGHEPEALLSLQPEAAAELVHRLHGRVIGGSRLEVIPQLSSETVLPAVDRSRRDHSRRDRSPLWLEVEDEESRVSLTPESIAVRQAERFRGPEVIDVFGGVGGNAVALAQAGKHVWMIEPNRTRLDVARRNLAARGLKPQVVLIEGCLEAELGSLLTQYPGAGLFLDPPWGGRDWDRKGGSWESLLGRYEGLLESVEKAAEVVIKLPRSFDLDSLVSKDGRWDACLEWDAEGVLPKMLTAWSFSPAGVPE